MSRFADRLAARSAAIAGTSGATVRSATTSLTPALTPHQWLEALYLRVKSLSPNGIALSAYPLWNIADDAPEEAQKAARLMALADAWVCSDEPKPAWRDEALGLAQWLEAASAPMFECQELGRMTLHVMDGIVREGVAIQGAQKRLKPLMPAVPQRGLFA